MFDEVVTVWGLQTFAVLSSFFLVMTLYPEVMKMAQKQLDKVLGSVSGSESGHLPTLSEDADRLTYLTAVVYETLRWNAIAPFGIVSQVLS